MKSNFMGKFAIVIAALIVSSFMVTPAMAVQLSARSAEMTLGSSCDLAGTITLKFNSADYAAFLPIQQSGQAVILRITLTGTQITSQMAPATLCKSIPIASYANTCTTRADAVCIDEQNKDVSDVIGASPTGGADGINDITAYVTGTKDRTYFEIYITNMQVIPSNLNEDNWPWIKVGYNNNLINPAKTAICANIRDFAAISKLTISVESDPKVLTLNTSDNEIGHFLNPGSFVVGKCTTTVIPGGKGQPDTTVTPCASGDTKTIYLCGTSTEQVGCATYYQCATITGAVYGNIRLNINTGTSDYFGVSGAVPTTQSGVFLKQIIVRTADGNTELARWSATTCYSTKSVDLDFTTPTTGLGQIQVCINYEVSAGAPEGSTSKLYLVGTEAAQANTNARFWFSYAKLPCGNLFPFDSNAVTNNTHMLKAAEIKLCPDTPGVISCSHIYFPYVLFDTKTASIGNWSSGISIVNTDDSFDLAKMEVIFKLHDMKGNVSTYKKNNFTTRTWANSLDQMLKDNLFDKAPTTPGYGWLEIIGNFNYLDGYLFIYSEDGVFGSNLLPRPLKSCVGTQFGAIYGGDYNTLR